MPNPTPPAHGFIDPYVYAGTTVLQNKFGITKAESLANVEYRLTWARRMELQWEPIAGNFDLAHLQETHRILFQDIYDWAGELRTVNIHKGNSDFHPVTYFQPAAEFTFAELHKSHLLSGAPIIDEVFIAELAEILALINEAHYFRDGNGRAQRAFLDQVAACSGRVLSWRNVGDLENYRVSQEAFEAKSGVPFRAMLKKVLAPAIDGLDPFDDDVYQVSRNLIPFDPNWSPR